MSLIAVHICLSPATDETRSHGIFKVRKENQATIHFLNGKTLLAPPRSGYQIYRDMDESLHVALMTAALLEYSNGIMLCKTGFHTYHRRPCHTRPHDLSSSQTKTT